MKSLVKINSMAANDPAFLVSKAEERYSDRLDEIAERIFSDREKRIVMLAGPSASGKTTTAGLIASRLRPGGVLHVATDHVDYAEWIGPTGDAEPALERLDTATDVGHVPFSLDRPVTKFEGKGLQEERVINEFLWRRRG